MKKLFVFADVHGFYSMMEVHLKEKGFDINNEDHIFVSCGDLFDRGPENDRCLDFVNSLPDDRKILVRGNHEDLLLDALHRGYFMQHDYHNHTLHTVSQLSGFEIDDILDQRFTCAAACTALLTNEDFKKYINSVSYFHYIGDYIFVHGWIPSRFRDGFPLTAKDRITDNWMTGDWEDAVWTNGMKAWQRGERIMDHTIVCGHYHTSWGHTHIHHKGVEFAEVWYETGTDPDMEEHFETFKDDGIIALDGCTAYSGIMNCEVIEVEDVEWQLRMSERTMNEPYQIM